MATEDTTEDTAPAAEAAAKTSGGLLKAVGTTLGLFVLMLISQLVGPVLGCKLLPDLLPGCAAPATVAETGDAKGKKPAKPKGPPHYMAMDPAMVVSFQDAGTMRFLQVDVEVMARDEKVLEQVKTHMPVIRNNLLMMMGGQTLATLTSRDEKEKLRLASLAEVQRILKENAGPDDAHGNVEDLYFTSFVVQ